MPEISVIMATYNRKKYVSRAIESILNQTYKDFEFIIMDDGSDDGSSDVIIQYADKDKRIKYIKQENKGQAHARNTGASHSQCKYIAFMDDDDISIPQRLEKQFKFMEHNPKIDACTAMLEFITSDGKNIRYATIIGNSLPRDNTMLRYAFPLPFILDASTMIKKEAFNACSGFRISSFIIGDIDFTLRFQERFSATILAEYLYQYDKSNVELGDKETTRDPVNSIKLYISSYLCAWFRRNTNSDPVDENKSLDEIMALIPKLPQITRNSIYDDLIHPLCNNVITSIKSGKYISDEELTSLIKVIKHTAPKEFTSKFTYKLKKTKAKKLIKQGKLIQAYNTSRVKL